MGDTTKKADKKTTILQHLGFDYPLTFFKFLNEELYLLTRRVSCFGHLGFYIKRQAKSVALLASSYEKGIFIASATGKSADKVLKDYPTLFKAELETSCCVQNWPPDNFPTVARTFHIGLFKTCIALNSPNSKGKCHE